MVVLAVLMVAAAQSALDHPVRALSSTLVDRPLFVSDMIRIVPASSEEYLQSETATPVLDPLGKRLYVGTHDGLVRCRFRGRTDWTWYGTGSVLAAPLLDGEKETLYVASAGGLLTALNSIKGKVRWQADLREELTTTPTLSPKDGRLFVMSSEEAVTAVSPEGKSLWKYRRDAPAGFTLRGNARPQLAHDLLYAGFADGTVAALNPADGVPKWTRNVSGTGDYLDVDSIEAPEDDTHVYAASAKVGVVALDAASGEVTWTAPIPGATSVVLDGPRVYAAARGAVVALDRADGKELWRFRLTHDRYATQPAAIAGLVLVSADRGPLFALDATTGKPRSSFDPGSGFSMTPLAVPARGVPGLAYVLSNAGALFTLGIVP